MTKLSQLPQNSPGLVLSVEEGTIKLRLMELGIFPGVELEVLFTAPGGCPIAISVGGEYVLGLRREEADLVTVRIFN